MAQDDARAARDRPAMEDVAALAGVSLGTVSNVLNHPYRVTARTRERVQRAIAELNYVPNGLARSLAAGHTNTIGLIVSDLSNSLFIDIARGAETAAEEGRMSLLLANTDSRVEREAGYLALFAQHQLTGVLMTLNDAAHFDAVTRIAPASPPLVLLNFTDPQHRHCSVDVDNELGGYLAAQHLIEIGRRRLVLVSGPPELKPVADRGRGFFRAVAEHPEVTAREVTPRWINRADGWRTGTQLAPQVAKGEVDGIFAASDLLAAGILQALATTPGVVVPRDVAVVGYDNNQAAWDSPIPLTTIAQPGHEVGRLGARLVREESSARGTHTHQAIVLAPALVVRSSTVESPPRAERPAGQPARDVPRRAPRDGLA
ncbi:LacI family DNA-binding transcriptional regulator [Cellulomonas sp. NS3]|uniref:LacI family DNA-binding transcriptional regulator n=1 Tax=Cellulomonas sp. NS3 TaxID=2973977 RepID=UPI002161BB05|nr:LacI family DNA-binding transcriptional regulator [Cellulomonas sp. NS3]